VTVTAADAEAHYTWRAATREKHGAGGMTEYERRWR